MTSIALIHQDHSYALDPLSMSGPLGVPACLPFFDNVSSSSQAGHSYQDAVKTVREGNGGLSEQDMVEELPWQQPASEGTARENASAGSGRDLDENFARYVTENTVMLPSISFNLILPELEIETKNGKD
jgi:hypothetical protein